MSTKSKLPATLAIVICLAAVVAVVMGYSQWRESNRHDAQQPPTSPAFSESAGEKKIQVGSNPDKGIWIQGTASKIDSSKSPTNAREVARNTLLRYENNLMDLELPQVSTHLSQLLGFKVELGHVSVSLRPLKGFKQHSDGTSEMILDEKAGPQLPSGKKHQILERANKTTNAEEFIEIIVAESAQGSLKTIWTKDGVEVVPSE